MIKILPEHIVQKIAAGEVIERPASVVKELIENAIDAHANRITIDIERSGQELIRISDNGDGMTPEELKISTERHATSKLNNFQDLYTLHTLGFRGEALPSIAAISRFTAISQSKDVRHPSWKIEIAGGKKIHDAQTSRSQGTTVEVRDLFFNTPARKKFLKKEVTEYNQIIRIIDELCLTYPGISFQLFNNQKEALNLPKTGDYVSRAQAVIGKTYSEKLIPVEAAYPWIRITGLISRPFQWTSSRKKQYCFINNRPVIHRTVTRALYDSYHGGQPEGQHPIALLWLDINPDLVDINVHPTKREVRLTREHELYQVLVESIRTCITSTASSPVFSLPPITERAQGVQEAVESFYSKHAHLVKQAFRPHTKTLPSQDFLIPAPSFSETSVRVLGQLSSLYVLAEAENELWIIDQHAAEERVLFETFSSRHQDKGITQKLLIPFHWEMPLEQFSFLQPLLHDFKELGIVMEEFGTHSMVVREIPPLLGAIKEVEHFMHILLENLWDNQNLYKEDIIPRKEAIIRAACRAAVKSRDVLSGPQIGELIKKLQQCKQPFTCPHGRPTLIRLTKHEIDRRFGR